MNLRPMVRRVMTAMRVRRRTRVELALVPGQQLFVRLRMNVMKMEHAIQRLEGVDTWSNPTAQSAPEAFVLKERASRMEARAVPVVRRALEAMVVPEVSRAWVAQVVQQAMAAPEVMAEQREPAAMVAMAVMAAMRGQGALVAAPVLGAMAAMLARVAPMAEWEALAAWAKAV